jgi:hypothetical protein
MAIFDTNTGFGNLVGGMNVFGARQPEYLGGLLTTDQQEQLKNQALLSGLIGTAATYFAQPKNQGIGLPAILGKSYLGGMQASQGAYNTATENAMNTLKIQRELRDAQLDYLKAIPAEIRQFEYGVQNPEYFKREEKLRTLSRPQTNVVTNVSNKEFASNVIKDLEGSLTAGMEAQNTLPTYRTMSQLIDQGVQTGAGAEAAKTISKAGQLLVPGFNVDTVARTEAFDSLSKNVIIPQVKKLGANPTNTDLQFIVDSAPSIGKTPEGNKLLLNALEIGAKRDAALAEWAANWQIQNADILERSPSQARAKLFKDRLQFTKDLQAQTSADVLAIKSQVPGMVQGGTGVIKNKNILFRN